MSLLYKPIDFVSELYYMSNGLTSEILIIWDLRNTDSELHNYYLLVESINRK